MTTPRRIDPAPGGSSPGAPTRYDSSPVGGLGTAYGDQPPIPDDDDDESPPEQPGYEEGTTPGGCCGEPAKPGGTYGGQRPPSTTQRYGDGPVDSPSTYGESAAEPGYDVAKPSEEAPPEGGYGPEDPQYGPAATPPETPAAGGDKDHPCPPSMTCDLTGLDDISCEAEAVKAESEALAKDSENLEKRRAAFKKARADYTKARDEATKTVKELHRRVDDILAAARCLLNRDEVTCLDKAFTQVLDCLEDCPGLSGCCVEPCCGFEDQKWTAGQYDVLLRRVEKVEKCFDDVLVAEPANLTKRVEDIKKYVEELGKAMSAEPRNDAYRLYARAKKAKWDLGSIWREFDDVNEFQDCLCRGLSCSLRGRQWLAQLAGKKKYQECQEKARADRCTWLKENMVDETLATQLILCPPSDPGCECPEEPTSTSA